MRMGEPSREGFSVLGARAGCRGDKDVVTLTILRAQLALMAQLATCIPSAGNRCPASLSRGAGEAGWQAVPCNDGGGVSRGFQYTVVEG
jgi:hypothetical protein